MRRRGYLLSRRAALYIQTRFCKFEYCKLLRDVRMFDDDAADACWWWCDVKLEEPRCCGVSEVRAGTIGHCTKGG
jgi:hypothetical protein